MTRRDKVAKSLLKPINPSVIIILGLYTILWGLWILSPFWTVFTQASLYSTMMGIATEPIWGCIAIFAGIIITRGAVAPSYKNLRVGSFIAFFHWLTIGMLYLAGDWMNTGGITALTFAAYSAVIWLNLKVNKAYYR